MKNEFNPRVCLDALRKMVHILSGALQEPEVVKVFLSQVAEVLSAKHTLLLLLSRDAKKLMIAGALGIDERYLRKGPVELARSGVNRQALEGGLVAVGDTSREPDFSEQAVTDPSLRGLIATSLSIRGHVIGVLHVYSENAHPVIGEENTKFIQTISDMGAAALEKARMHQGLYRIAQALNSSLELEAVLKRVLEVTVEEMWLKAASIRLLDHDRQLLRLIGAYGLSESYRGKGQVHLAKSPIDQRVLQGEVVVVSDVAEEPGLEYPRELIAEGIFALMAAPLTLKGTPLGVMRVYSAQQRRFSDVGKNFLSSAADIISLAIDNAHLYATMKKRYKDLKSDLADWHHFLALG